MGRSDSESSDSDSGIRYKTENTRQTHQSSSSFDSIGPQLPSNLNIGPQLPPKKKLEVEAPNLSIGPQLPSNLTIHEDFRKPEKDSYGPQLPPHLTKTVESPKNFGPQIPQHLREQLAEESDDDAYGPMPEGSKFSKAQVALEERALQMKMDQLEPAKANEPSREEWMLELPDVKTGHFGFGARQFRKKGGPDMSNRSSWTDTPDKKEKAVKVDLKQEAVDKEMRRRDAEQAKMAKKLKRQQESLLDLHQSKMKKKDKDKGPVERRPFSRDVDLQVNRFDEAQKKAVLKKAELLDDRFSSGKSKFL